MVERLKQTNIFAESQAFVCIPADYQNHQQQKQKVQSSKSAKHELDGRLLNVSSNSFEHRNSHLVNNRISLLDDLSKHKTAFEAVVVWTQPKLISIVEASSLLWDSIDIGA